MVTSLLPHFSILTPYFIVIGSFEEDVVDITADIPDISTIVPPFPTNPSAELSLYIEFVQSDSKPYTFENLGAPNVPPAPSEPDLRVNAPELAFIT